MQSRNFQNQVLVLAFERTLTIADTTNQTSLAKFESAKNYRFRWFLDKLCCAQSPLEDFRHSMTDRQVCQNLRNPRQIRTIVKYFLERSGKVAVFAEHDNIPWVKRNLRLIMDYDNAFRKIKVIHISPKQSRIQIINIMKKDENSIQKFLFVDESDTEIKADDNKFKPAILGIPSSNPVDFEIETIRSTIGSDQYIDQLAEKIGIPQFYFATLDIDISETDTDSERERDRMLN